MTDVTDHGGDQPAGLLARQRALQAEAGQVREQPDLAHLRALPGRLADDTRLAILRIKTVWSARPQYGTSVRSWDIYTAVLDDGVRSSDEFDEWLTRR